jgi:hypothetical protein
MIKIVLRLLQNELPIGDPDIDFAIGSNKYPATYKEAFKLIKHNIKRRWQRIG